MSWTAASAAPLRLSAAPFPEPGEHPSGYLRRLCATNGMPTLDVLLKAMELRGLCAGGGTATWEALAAATGLDIAIFDEMRMPTRSFLQSKAVTIDGLAVRTSQVVVQSFRFCPTCLAEERIVPYRWFVHHVTACERHEARLVDQCPGCGSKLRLKTMPMTWTCRSCGFELVDTIPTQASQAELGLLDALLGAMTPRGGCPLPDEFMQADAETKLSIVDRLGRLAIQAADDSPIGAERTVYTQGNVDPISPLRTLEESRAVVNAAMPLLADWPGGYRKLLAGLVDRVPYSNQSQSFLRRIATKAGRLAMRPLCISGKKAVPFIDRERERFCSGVLGYQHGSRHPRPLRQGLQHLDGLAKPASLRPDEYVSLAHALAQLGGASLTSLDGWIKADLLELHRTEENAYLLTRRSVELAVCLLRLLPPDRGKSDLVEIADIWPTLKKTYQRQDLLIDIVTGHVETFVRRPKASGLDGLAMSARDIDRRRASAVLASAATADHFRLLFHIMGYVAKIWGPIAIMSSDRVDELVDAGAIRRRLRGSRNVKEYSVADVLAHLQVARSLRPVFRLDSPHACDKDGWRPSVIDAPRYKSVREMTGYYASQAPL